MNMFSRTLAFSLVVLSLTAVAEYKRVEQPFEGDPLDAHIYELDNGLRVYLTLNPEEPRFYAEIAVRAGSKHDPAETTGLAHYLEHLLFKGTQQMGTIDYEKEAPLLDKITQLYEDHFVEDDPEKRKAIYAEINETAQAAAAYAIPNEMDRLYSNMGGQALNAHTWYEETVYKVDLPANRLEQWAVIETERFSEPVFRLFHTELETVYEEKNRALDNKDRIIREAVAKTLFKDHPYGRQNTLGTVEHLKRPSLVNIENFYNTWYVPNNMAIMISGDIDVDKTMAIIDRTFSSWEPRDLPAAPVWDGSAPKGIQRVEVSYEGEEFVLIGFRTAARRSEDAEALQLIDMILDNSVAGLINLNLNQAQRVRQAGSYPMLMNEGGAQYLYGVPKDGQTLEEVEQLLLNQIEIIKKGEFEDWILPAIINDFKKTQKRSIETNTGRVHLFNEAFLSFRDWDDLAGSLERMARLTEDDIVRVANEYFGDDYVVGYRRDAQHEVPEIEKPAIDPLPLDPSRVSDFAKQVMSMNTTPIDPVFIDPETDYRIEKDPNGVHYYYARNPVNDLFTLTITVDFGTHENNKIGPAVQLLNKSGTSAFSSEDLKKEWYKLGTDFAMTAGDNTTVIQISGLDENLEPSLDLLTELLTDPAADQATLDELVNIILVSREDMKKQAPGISAALIQYNRYGEDSSFLRLLPSTEMKQLTVEELHGLVTGLLDYKHAVSYVGSRPMAEVVAAVKKRMPASSELKDPPPFRFLKAREIDETEIYFIDKETAQSTVRIEFGSETYNPAHIPAIQLYNEYFAGGMAGIVFQELREARALAYAAGARYAPGSRKGDQNIMLAGIGTQADKTFEATAAFTDLLNNLPESPERFAMARAALEEQYRTAKVGFREVLARVRAWEKLELEVDPRETWFDVIANADESVMLTFVRDQVTGQPHLISIVGEKAKIDMDALAELGTVKEISLDTIFVE